MDGALIAGLVRGCLSLLLSRRGAAGGGGGGSSSSAAVKKDRRGAVECGASLQLEVLHTLHALMEGVLSPEPWRSVLPRCFVGLYLAALEKLR